MTILKSFKFYFVNTCVECLKVLRSPTAVMAALGPLQFTSALSENIKLCRKLRTPKNQCYNWRSNVPLTQPRIVSVCIRYVF